MDWDQIKDIVRFWIGWHVLDWLRPVAGGAVVTIGGWLIARYRQSHWQRELRGAAIGFVILTIILALLSKTPERIAPPTSQRPLADDGIKWRIVNHLYDDVHGTELKIPPICMMHLDSEYSENLARDVTDILRRAGYWITPCVRKAGADIPRGVTIWSSRLAVVSNQAEYIKNRFESIANLPVDHIFLDDPTIEKPFPLCQDANTDVPCLAVTIGNPHQP